MRSLTDEYRAHHWSEMPTTLSGEEWEPRQPRFERARTAVARKLKWHRDNVMDWEVRSYLRERETGTTALPVGSYASRRALAENGNG